MWSDLRVEIEQARQRLRLPKQEFAPLPFTTEWASLEERIYHAFCRLNHPTVRPCWLWERLRPGAVGLVCEYDPLTQLTSLVDPEEIVWLVLNETVSFRDKFWFYWGTPHAIHSVLAECYYLDEVYLISKKYTWLLCLNHHDALYGIGSPIQERLLARGAKSLS
ncbi:hypothetical protein HMJ29_03790 [Hymenobacter taeanensis]|uniref:Uncharacterized protein n=1 Tax=Hymenobacter taeanensis TaxID=2735321 RepID=A0A6M6BD17_9BACT|nr:MULTISPECIES: DUF6756 family protein [Hymenobacter]QJX46106.1 hypothetical protein HMJ29_03790 [Hymenobacter taeanensis]UOQ79964.1 hypothetical protein MUN83_14055 [Hymenobacter sp. 5414T-23]